MPLPARREYHTVVAGAGPAGVMAAYHAARRGSVLLVDTSPLPREKSCGGMLHEWSRQFLAPYGTIPESIVLDPRHVSFRYVDLDRRVRKETSLVFLNVDRAGFDDWLLSLLPDDVELACECRVSDHAEDADGCTVTLSAGNDTAEVRCANVVGADGARSTVRRAIGSGSNLSYVTIQDHVELNGDIDPCFDCIYLRGVGDEFAYAYVVPKGPRAIVGSVFYPKSRKPGEKQDYIMTVLRSAMPQLGPSVKREAAAALCVRTRGDVIAGRGRVLLAGESGGFMSPTSGEGISYALRTGASAGLAIAGSAPGDALAAHLASTRTIAADIRRRLKWLPVMESPVGKYVAGLMPSAIVSRVTEGL